jgi:hypothetical protein
MWKALCQNICISTLVKGCAHFSVSPVVFFSVCLLNGDIPLSCFSSNERQKQQQQSWKPEKTEKGTKSA